MPSLSNLDLQADAGAYELPLTDLQQQVSALDFVLVPNYVPPTPVPPVVSNITPAAGTAVTARTPVGFDVTDDSGVFRRIMLVASFPTLGLLEVVHDGDNFAPLYAAASTREAITNGFRYAALRNGGWPASPTLIPYAIDQEGAEAL